MNYYFPKRSTSIPQPIIQSIENSPRFVQDTWQPTQEDLYDFSQIYKKAVIHRSYTNISNDNSLVHTGRSLTPSRSNVDSIKDKLKEARSNSITTTNTTKDLPRKSAKTLNDLHKYDKLDSNRSSARSNRSSKGQVSHVLDKSGVNSSRILSVNLDKNNGNSSIGAKVMKLLNIPKQKGSVYEKTKEVALNKRRLTTAEISSKRSDCSLAWLEEENSRLENSLSIMESEKSFREGRMKAKLFVNHEESSLGSKLMGKLNFWESPNVTGNISMQLKSLNKAGKSDKKDVLHQKIKTQVAKKTEIAMNESARTTNRSFKKDATEDKVKKLLEYKLKAFEDFGKKMPKSLDNVTPKNKLSNENPTKIVSLNILPKSNSTEQEGKIKNINESQGIKQKYKLAIPLQISPMKLSAVSKMQLVIQQMTFRRLNAVFQKLKDQTLARENLHTTVNQSRRMSTHAGFTSLMSERSSNVHFVGAVFKNIVNKRLQAVFEKLKSSSSLHEIQYKASIVSGAIVLTKLFAAKERSLCTQFICIWKLWDALRVQRDKELAAKDEEISQISYISKVKPKAPRIHHQQEEEEISTERGELRSARFAAPQNKENKETSEYSFRTKKEPLANAENKNKISYVDPAPVIKKNQATEGPQEKAKSPNQVLYERLKALYEQKQAEKEGNQTNYTSSYSYLSNQKTGMNGYNGSNSVVEDVEYVNGRHYSRDCLESGNGRKGVSSVFDDTNDSYLSTSYNKKPKANVSLPWKTRNYA